MKDNSYKVLKKLIKISSRTFGIIEYSENFNRKFKIPDRKLYNIFALLERKMFIDSDFLDKEAHKFQAVYILPDGYRCIEQRRNNAITTFTSAISIAIAAASFVVSLFMK